MLLAETATRPATQVRDEGTGDSHLPALGRSVHEIIESSTDLPDPEGPATTVSDRGHHLDIDVVECDHGPRGSREPAREPISADDNGGAQSALRIASIGLTLATAIVPMPASASKATIPTSTAAPMLVRSTTTRAGGSRFRKRVEMPDGEMHDRDRRREADEGAEDERHRPARRRSPSLPRRVAVPFAAR